MLLRADVVFCIAIGSHLQGFHTQCATTSVNPDLTLDINRNNSSGENISNIH